MLFGSNTAPMIKRRGARAFGGIVAGELGSTVLSAVTKHHSSSSVVIS
jgi:hypothetical protein